MNGQPHAGWADVYDRVYARCFDELYAALTAATLAVIEERLAPDNAIVDFGAGTGRLSIPLAARGFIVTAVEPCQAMLDQLASKHPPWTLKTHCAAMQDFTSDERFDMALCVFTVLLYLLDEQALTAALAAAHACLKPGGLFMVDIPSRYLFRDMSFSSEVIDRQVAVTMHHEHRYQYRESVRIRDTVNEAWQCYEDEFLIRYWPSEQVLDLLRKTGFEIEADFSRQFNNTGSKYYMLRKMR